jgi:hypothetical protein
MWYCHLCKNHLPLQHLHVYTSSPRSLTDYESEQVPREQLHQVRFSTTKASPPTKIPAHIFTSPSGQARNIHPSQFPELVAILKDSKDPHSAKLPHTHEEPNPSESIISVLSRNHPNPFQGPQSLVWPKQTIANQIARRSFHKHKYRERNPVSSVRQNRHKLSLGRFNQQPRVRNSSFFSPSNEEEEEEDEYFWITFFFLMYIVNNEHENAFFLFFIVPMFIRLTLLSMW